MTPPDGIYPQPDVTRFEVIDETGRAYVWHLEPTLWEFKLSYQDRGRTLKVFVDRREP